MDHILTLKHTPGGGGTGQQIGANVNITADMENNADMTVANNATNAELDIIIPTTALKAIMIYTEDISGTLTVKTNSSSAPDQTFTITGGKPFVWYTGCGITNPITTAVTKVYVTRIGTGGTLKFRVLSDGTP